MKPSEYGLNRCRRKAIAIPASVAGVAMESPNFLQDTYLEETPGSYSGGWQSQTLKDRFTDIIQQKQNPLVGGERVAYLRRTSSRLDRHRIIHQR